MPGYNPTENPKTAKQIADLVAGTQELIIKRKALVNLMTDLTDYVGLRELWKKHQHQFQGGIDWEFDVIMDHNHTARFTKLYSADTANHVDATVKGKVGPRFYDASYTYELREKALQSNNAITIFDFIKTKMAQAQQSAKDLLEDAVWGAPAYASDDVTPFGLAYWVTKMANSDVAANPLGGFVGKGLTLPKSASDATQVAIDRAGISSTTYPRWRNFAAQYTNISKTDLVEKMRRAHYATDFKSPITAITDPSIGSGSGIYVGLDTIGELESILEAQNMNLGNDLLSKDGKCLFKSAPITYAPKLNGDATAPIYMIDWTSIALGVLAGWNEHWSEPKEVAGSHNVRQVFLDGSVNMVCTNLRKQAVIHKALA